MLSALLAIALAQAQPEASYYTPEEAQALFAQANDASSRGEYEKAIQGYQRLLERGFGGVDVLYNLGTTQLAADRLGEAIWAFERALRLERSSDIEANLALARSRQLDQVVGAQGDEPFVVRVARAIDGAFVSWSFLFTWVLGLGLLIVARFVRRSALRWSGAALTLIAVLLGGLLSAHAYVDETYIEGVVLAKELKARELPKENAKVSFEVHAGLKVRILESEGKFVKIRLPNGLEGWAEQEGMARI